MGTNARRFSRLWVDAEVTDSGGSGLVWVQIKLDDGEYEAMPAKSGGDRDILLGRLGVS
jgi:hypothetical protein